LVLTVPLPLLGTAPLPLLPAPLPLRSAAPPQNPPQWQAEPPLRDALAHLTLLLRPGERGAVGLAYFGRLGDEDDDDVVIAP